MTSSRSAHLGGVVLDERLPQVGGLLFPQSSTILPRGLPGGGEGRCRQRLGRPGWLAWSGCRSGRGGGRGRGVGRVVVVGVVGVSVGSWWSAWSGCRSGRGGGVVGSGRGRAGAWSGRGGERGRAGVVGVVGAGVVGAVGGCRGMSSADALELTRLWHHLRCPEGCTPARACWEVGPPGTGERAVPCGAGRSRGTGSGAALHSLVIRRLRSEGFGRFVIAALFWVAAPLAAGWR